MISCHVPRKLIYQQRHHKDREKSFIHNIFNVVVDCKGFLFDLWHC